MEKDELLQNSLLLIRAILKNATQFILVTTRPSPLQKKKERKKERKNTILIPIIKHRQENSKEKRERNSGATENTLTCHRQFIETHIKIKVRE